MDLKTKMKGAGKDKVCFQKTNTTMTNAAIFIKYIATSSINKLVDQAINHDKTIGDSD